MHNLSTFSTNPGQAPATKTVTGQFIAKATASYPKWRRAEDAARWLRGELTIKPTAKLAAATFGVDVRLVAEAREHLKQLERRHTNGGGLPGLSEDAVERIVVEVGIDRIWRVVDRMTQPERPLVAAE